MSYTQNIKFSIILPVRNGGDFVKECVLSILNQTFLGWELHVLDNDSKDQTRDWINELGDHRIKVIPSIKSLSIEENWSRIAKIQKNEFCTLIGHDDILDSHYLEEMNRLIELHPTASLYTSHFRYIDAQGKTIRKCKPMKELYSAPDFLASFMESSIDSMGTGFMMRSKVYDSLGGIPPKYPNLLFADFELWINLARLAYVVSSPKECFAFRLHQSMTTTSSDLKLQEAFFIFTDFLVSLKKLDGQLASTIQEHGLNYIRFYCRSFSHRMLRTPLEQRGNQTVAGFIAVCKRYADRLSPGNDWDPSKTISINLARLIDSNSFSRRLFLLFKRFYKKPLYS
jgi:glycosyltransferase involved in cell wall biosynthesis